MENALIELIIAIVIVGIVVFIVQKIVDMIPMDGQFKALAKLLIYLVAVLIIVLKALPLLRAAI